MWTKGISNSSGYIYRISYFALGISFIVCRVAHRAEELDSRLHGNDRNEDSFLSEIIQAVRYFYSLFLYFVFFVEEEDFWFVGTAEIPLTNLHRDEILPADALPLNYAAYSACFRREKMSAGRDVRGIKRGHQFDKVEMYKITTPETSYRELEAMVRDAEAVCQALEIPYRLVEMCTGDLGFQAAKKYDLEMWAPGIEEWLEVSSLSNCTDFQSRRANIRYRPEKGAKPRYVHTLNGSGLALPRVMIAVMENYQQADGSILVPEVLRPYMGGVEVIG